MRTVGELSRLAGVTVRTCITTSRSACSCRAIVRMPATACTPTATSSARDERRLGRAPEPRIALGVGGGPGRRWVSGSGQRQSPAVDDSDPGPGRRRTVAAAARRPARCDPPPGAAAMWCTRSRFSPDRPMERSIHMHIVENRSSPRRFSTRCRLHPRFAENHIAAGRFSTKRMLRASAPPRRPTRPGDPRHRPGLSLGVVGVGALQAGVNVTVVTLAHVHRPAARPPGRRVSRSSRCARAAPRPAPATPRPPDRAGG
jgi:hypothetical protein